MALRRGSTLVELLVVLFMWSTLLLVILGFYAQSRKISQRHSELSDDYRATRAYFDSCDGYLRHAKILDVKNRREDGATPRILFRRTDLTQPILEGGLVHWAQSEELLTFDARPNTQWLGTFPFEPDLVVLGWDTRDGKQVKTTLAHIPKGWKCDFYNKLLPAEDTRLTYPKGHGLTIELTIPQRNQDLAQLTDSSFGTPKEFAMLHYLLLENADD